MNWGVGGSRARTIIIETYKRASTPNLPSLARSGLRTAICVLVWKPCRKLPPKTSESSGVYTAWTHPGGISSVSPVGLVDRYSESVSGLSD